MGAKNGSVWLCCRPIFHANMSTSNKPVPVCTSDLYGEDKLTIETFTFINVSGPSEQKLLITEVMQALFTLLQPNHLRTAKPTVIFLEGPPGTGKSTTLYWTYIQCKHMASWHPVAIPLLNMDDATTQQAIVCTMQKKGGNQQIIGLVDLMRPYELTSRAYSAFCSRVLPSVSLIVFAASLSYAVYQATECGTRFLPLYQRAITIQTRPFSTALAAEYWRAHTSCSSEVNLQKDIAVSKGIPRLLNLLCTAAHPEKAVKLGSRF